MRRISILAVDLLSIAALVTIALRPDEPVRAAQTITVTGNADGILAALAGNGTCDLREALTAANTNTATGECPAGDAGLDTIAFNIAPGGPVTISIVTAALPTITESLTIDGTTQGVAATPLVEVTRSGIFGGNGLTIAATTVVRGLVVTNFGGNGISMLNAGATNSKVFGSYVGVDFAGLAKGNGAQGISVENAPNVTIGSSLIGERNVISANLGNGINIFRSTGAGMNTVVEGNYIGTDLSGTLALPNGAQGIGIYASGTRIGGTAAGAGNVIAGNSGHGIDIAGNGTFTTIQGNHIGTNAAGDSDLGNGLAGISASTTGNLIGGAATSARNIISGNGEDGVRISNTTGNTVQGNYIGTDINGSGGIGNASAGVFLDDSSLNVVGGSTAQARNVISNNRLSGIAIIGQDATTNTIKGNYIGTTVSGTISLGNDLAGIYIEQAPFNTIGGGQPGDGNLISGNGNTGIYITGPDASDNVISGNFIGTNASGTGAIANSSHGILAIGSGPNVIGGGGANNGNTIAFNDDAGVAVVFSLPVSFFKGIRGNSIHSNSGLGIDLEADGVTPNDVGDGDVGGNGLQNFPVITSVATSPVTSIGGELNSASNTTFHLEFFANATCDPSGFGEGERFLGAGAATTDATGNTTFSFDFASAITPGEFITATATDSDDNTSEFSECFATGGGGDPCPGPSVINFVSGATGEVYCAPPFSLIPIITLRDPGPLPGSVSAVFEWNNAAQLFRFWFRGFPDSFQTLTSVLDGRYYFFQSTGGDSFANTGGTATLPPPGTTSINPTQAGANGVVWAGTDHAMADFNSYASLNPASAVFEWNNAAQLFNFWFRGFPDNFQTLTAGIQRGRYYFYQSTAGQEIPMD